jgi:hypothetical protein
MTSGSEQDIGLRNSVLYSEELKIDLRSRGDKEIFKWFLASLLFGGRITETIAKNTYRVFVGYRLLSPRSILKAGKFLVDPVMREGGYVRYDGRKSTQILSDCEKLMTQYEGSLTRLHNMAKDERDLEQRLLDFYGVGPVTANIFLRELRPYWKKADPEPLGVVKEMARKCGVRLEQYNRKTLRFARIEAGLIRSRRKIEVFAESPARSARTRRADSLLDFSNSERLGQKNATRATAVGISFASALDC